MTRLGNTVRVGRPREALLLAAQASRLDQDLVLYSSFRGDYADSPRAVFETLSKETPWLRHAWVVGSDATAELLPSGTPTVAYGSVEHFRALGRARLLVTNNNVPATYVKKPGAFYLQTWHGTPLKTIGHDRPGFDTAMHRARGALRRTTQGWDCLLSPSPAVSDLFRAAFRYRGRILESGYPRNDLLHLDDGGVRAAAIRRELGVPEGRRVVLYAPTFDDEVAEGTRPFALPLEPRGFERALGDECVLLVRLHPRLRRMAPSFAGPACIDVTAHPDMRDLLLVADVLVTDYSSCFFDVVGAGKPVVFFLPDRERFERVVRGIYLDIDATPLPGPVVTDEESLVACIADGGWWSSDRPEVRSFRETYCVCDDGRATRRVLDEVILPALQEREAA